MLKQQREKWTLLRALTAAPKAHWLKCSREHISELAAGVSESGGQGTPPMPRILPVAPADAKSHDEIMRISQSQRWLQNQRAKHLIHCSKSLPDDFYLLCEEERRSGYLSQVPLCFWATWKAPGGDAKISGQLKVDLQICWHVRFRTPLDHQVVSFPKDRWQSIHEQVHSLLPV